jgi:DNA-binding SARP family transcriptional activator
MEVLLATLLIRANQVVPSSQLLSELWGENPPRQATAGLYVYISQLRKMLARKDCPENPIITRPPGYLLQLRHEELDLHQFEVSMRAGRQFHKSGDHTAAADSLERALSLWRGAPFGGLRGGPLVNSFSTWLEESRLECIETLTEIHLRLGRHRETVSTLYALIADHPSREEFYRLLMIALHRSGRQADALRMYQHARNLIVRELGVEPSRSLRELHQEILHADQETVRADRGMLVQHGGIV